MSKFKECLSFDNVSLVPQYSEILSREDVDLSNILDEKLGIRLSLPLVSSPMDTISEERMIIAMSESGGLGIIHRYNSTETQSNIIKKIEEYGNYHQKRINFGIAIGVKDERENFERIDNMLKRGGNVVCVDIAHGHHTLMKNMIKSIKSKYKHGVHIMAGNVATTEGFQDLVDWGANSVRVGIGNGSICTTKIMTGHFVPLFQSLLDVSAMNTSNVKIIADGGISCSGNIVKCLGAGADFVMLGALLAGTDETPGHLTERNKKIYKIYRGMAGRDAQQLGKGKIYSIEGIEQIVENKGSVLSVLEEVRQNMKSGLSYSGARNIRELQIKAKFVKT